LAHRYINRYTDRPRTSPPPTSSRCDHRRLRLSYRRHDLRSQRGSQEPTSSRRAVVCRAGAGRVALWQCGESAICPG